jgi:hypothetical protein
MALLCTCVAKASEDAVNMCVHMSYTLTLACAHTHVHAHTTMHMQKRTCTNAHAQTHTYTRTHGGIQIFFGHLLTLPLADLVQDPQELSNAFLAGLVYLEQIQKRWNLLLQ